MLSLATALTIAVAALPLLAASIECLALTAFTFGILISCISWSVPVTTLKQDVLQHAITHFISLGAARQELVYTLGKTGDVSSYTASYGSRCSFQPTAHNSYSQMPL